MLFVIYEVTMPHSKPKSPSLDRDDWVRAGLELLSSGGVKSVRVEALAKRLTISKGSFYWHFKDREDLLGAMLATWESQQIGWGNAEEVSSRNAAQEWARLLETVSEPDRGRVDLAIFSWAREDENIRYRVTEIEKHRTAYLARIFRQIGFNSHQAEQWAGAALLAYVGWVDRATRDAVFRESGPDLPTVLSRIILAASSLASQEA